MLKKIVAMRKSSSSSISSKKNPNDASDVNYDTTMMSSSSSSVLMSHSRYVRGFKLKNAQTGMTVLDEVKEIISIPNKTSKFKRDPATVSMGPVIESQLRDYVKTIASMYRDNPFHNFKHASHVTQSLTKLLSRVVTPDTIDYHNMKYKKKAATRQLHEYTFGITSDPLIEFACALSALIHDVDHPGVPNSRLVEEKADIAILYKNKSVAEQNSVELAWDLLMEPKYLELRQVIYTTQAELDRFRQLIVNSVMATDVVDKELGALRKKRWDKAFCADSEHLLHESLPSSSAFGNNYNDVEDDKKKALFSSIRRDHHHHHKKNHGGNNDDGDDNVRRESIVDSVNRKATIVIEHLIQAADVAHTMQHWHVYRKWNERLFCEMYQAYLDGRGTTDPSEFWYEGELNFFDYYIIPLARKLGECGCFGYSSDECLDYAKANRTEWEHKGKQIVQAYLDQFRSKRLDHSGSITVDYSVESFMG